MVHASAQMVVVTTVLHAATRCTRKLRNTASFPSKRVMVKKEIVVVARVNIQMFDVVRAAQLASWPL